TQNPMLTLQPGERIININPGGGGYGDPLRRPVAAVLQDLRNGLVSPQGAALDYAVIVDADGQLDETATRLARDLH
ncbi:MAG: hydantoinase B/oxoprolinase family protein, partial [Pseudomonas capeferrum]